MRCQDERALTGRGRETYLEFADQGRRRRVRSQPLSLPERWQRLRPKDHLREPRGQATDDLPVLLTLAKKMQALLTSDVGVDEMRGGHTISQKMGPDRVEPLEREGRPQVLEIQ